MRHEKFEERTKAAIKIQELFRGYLQMKKDREDFLNARNAIIKVRTYFKILKNKNYCLEQYLNLIYFFNRFNDDSAQSSP
jgi:hypothetical protein